MLKLEPLPNDEVLIHYINEPRSGTFFDYNPFLRMYTLKRTVKYKLIGPLGELRELLAQYPKARIVNTLSHEPFITQYETEIIMAKLKTIADVAAWKRVQHERSDVIDEFGFHVYLRSDIDFHGDMEDVDLRYKEEV